MKKPFQVGERVVIYDYVAGPINRIYTISNVNKDVLGVIDSNYVFQYYHRKQCRRLVKKNRREIWVNPDIIGLRLSPYVMPSPASGWIRFIEAKKK